MTAKKIVKPEADNRKFLAYDYFRDDWINSNGCSLEQLEKEIFNYLKERAELDASEIEIFQKTSYIIKIKQAVEIV